MKIMSKYLHLRIAGTVFVLLLSGQVLSLTVYDVIQLSKKEYQDNDIITLIEVTHSAFELKAEDIPRLLDLGVSETVIQTMLKAAPKQTEARPPTGSSNPIVASTDNPNPASVDTKITVAGGSFDYKPFQEAGVGHHHRHYAVNMAGVKLLILRSKGAFTSTKKRARAIVARLGHAAVAGKGAFQADAIKGSEVVLFYGQKASNPMIILSVSPADALAYQRRSGRSITPNLLARYWSNLLSDYWSIAVNDVSPAYLTNFHEGEALKALYQQWTKPPVIPSTRLEDSVLLLSRQTQRHLLHLATTVPQDFLLAETYSLVEQP